jgi:predicted CXXCH cytochrome family protein
MKKLILAIVLGLLLVAAFTTLALADNGPHGGFTATTDACAGCHRAHSAKYGSNALLIMAPDLLCLSCHNGSGAGTNVEDGIYVQAGSDAYTGVAGQNVEGTDGRSLMGGGFVNALMAHTWNGAASGGTAASSQLTTSHHNYDGALSTVWGSGANNTANGTYALECVSCHDPHGNAGWITDGNVTNGTDTKTASYRLLRWQPSGSNGFSAPATSVNWSGGAFPVSDMGTVGGTDVSGWTVPDNFATLGTEWYTIGTTGAFAVGDYNAGNANNVYNLKNPTAPEATTYIPAAINVAYFCAQCHDRYFNNSRLRNNTDDSVYCGAPVAKTVNGVVLTVYPDADGVAPWIHPVDPARCEPVFDAAGTTLTGWGDNGPSGDNTYMFRHSSGDIRLSADGTAAAGNATSVSRSCVACHTAHGTTAVMTTLAGTADTTAVSMDGASLAGGSTLLRMDNRSICLRCHAGSVGFTIVP